MLVNELIAKLQSLPANAQVTIQLDEKNFRSPEPEQVWNDFAENYVVVL